MVIANILQSGGSAVSSATVRRETKHNTLDNKTLKETVKFILDEIQCLRAERGGGQGNAGWTFKIAQNGRQDQGSIETYEQATPLIEALLKKGPVITIKRIPTKEKEGHSKGKANANTNSAGVFGEQVVVVPRNNPLYAWGIKRCAVLKRGKEWVIGDDKTVVIIATGRHRGQPRVVSRELVRQIQKSKPDPFSTILPRTKR